MQTHVKVLGVLFTVLSAMGVIAALFLALAVTAASGIVGTAADPDAARVALPIIGIAGSALVTFLVVLAIPGLIVGIGLLKLKPWSRILGIVWSAVHLIYFPFGTALGIYGLWVLLSKETERLFQGTTGAITTPSV